MYELLFVYGSMQYKGDDVRRGLVGGYGGWRVGDFTFSILAEVILSIVAEFSAGIDGLYYITWKSQSKVILGESMIYFFKFLTKLVM